MNDLINSRPIFSKVAILAAFALASCNQSGAPAGAAVNANLSASESMKIWTDPDTGCKYFIYYYNFGNASTGGMAPRFRRDGKADCPDAH